MFDAIGKAAGYLKQLYKLKDDVEFMEAVAPLQEAIHDSQRDATKAISKIHELTVENIRLKEELAFLHSKQEFKENYHLYILPIGTHVWKLRDGIANNYPFICPTCLENGHKSGMQVAGRTLVCQKCHNKIRMSARRNVSQPKTIRSSFTPF